MSAKIYQFDLSLKDDFRLVSQSGDRQTHKSVTRFCPKCGKAKTDHAYFQSACFREAGKEKAKP